MDLKLNEIMKNAQGEVIVNDKGETLCQLCSNEGEIFEMYMSTDEIDVLTREIGEAESDTESVDEPMEVVNQPSTSRKLIWPKGISLFLLDQYTELYVHVGPMKKFRNKIEMWQAVVIELKEQFHFLCTPEQCESHLKSIKRSYATAEKKRMTSGSETIDSPYAEGMAKLKAIDDSLQPEVIVGVGQQRRLKQEKRRESSSNKKSEKSERDGVSDAKKSKVIQAMYDIHEKTQKKIDKRFNKMYNLVQQMYQSTNPSTSTNNQPQEISSDSE